MIHTIIRTLSSHAATLDWPIHLICSHLLITVEADEYSPTITFPDYTTHQILWTPLIPHNKMVWPTVKRRNVPEMMNTDHYGEAYINRWTRNSTVTNPTLHSIPRRKWSYHRTTSNTLFSGSHSQHFYESLRLHSCEPKSWPTEHQNMWQMPL